VCRPSDPKDTRDEGTALQNSQFTDKLYKRPFDLGFKSGAAASESLPDPAPPHFRTLGRLPLPIVPGGLSVAHRPTIRPMQGT
jgi:hypothetical protein